MSATETVWGIDPAISCLAVAHAAVDRPEITVTTLITRTDEREGARFGLLDRQLRIAAYQWATVHPPAVIWIEQPSGQHRALQLCYAVGVIQAALFETLAVPVWTIPSSAWKKRALGHGNATKQQVRAWVDAHGLEAGSQDEADAIGIAYAGRAMLLDGQWEVKAA